MRQRLPGIRGTEERGGSEPAYELRVANHGTGDLEMEVWQVPSAATPALKSPRRLAGLRGRNLSLMEHRVLKKLSEARVEIQGILPGISQKLPVAELPALQLALLFRVLAPMRNRDNMKQVADGIEEMSAEEASYWLGMAVHRTNPRRVLMALRFLLIDPKLSAKEVIRG
jgi:hypothetical protein